MIWKFLTINDYFANLTRYFTLKQNKIKPNSYCQLLSMYLIITKE